MRSDTALTLAEYANWLGANPWRLAQVENGDAVLKGDKCDDGFSCSFEYLWQAGMNSREFIIQAMRCADQIFQNWTNRLPYPTGVAADELDFPFPEAGFLNGVGEPKKFSLSWENWTNFGLRTYTQIADDQVLTRGAPDDVFTITALAVPDNTLATDVIVALTPADGGYTDGDVPPLEQQIRPLTVTIDSSGGAGLWTADIEGAAYLFVLSTLYEAVEPTCQEHELATYIEDVDIWISSVDTTDQGEFVWTANGNCANPPCAEDTDTLCLRREQMAMVSATPARYSDSVWANYCITTVPQFMLLNYIAGESLENGSFSSQFMVHILSLLTTAILEVDWEECCNPCMTAKFAFYNEIQKEIVTDGTESGTSIRGGAEYKMMKTDKYLDALGYDLRRGFVYALTTLRNAEYLKLSGSSL